MPHILLDKNSLFKLKKNLLLTHEILTRLCITECQAGVGGSPPASSGETGPEFNRKQR